MYADRTFVMTVPGLRYFVHIEFVSRAKGCSVLRLRDHIRGNIPCVIVLAIPANNEAALALPPHLTLLYFLVFIVCCRGRRLEVRGLDNYDTRQANKAPRSRSFTRIVAELHMVELVGTCCEFKSQPHPSRMKFLVDGFVGTFSA